MNEFNIKESKIKREDDEYSNEFIYETTGTCTIKSLWVDHENSLWLESNDNQRVVLPRGIRALIAKRIKETNFK